MSDEKKAVLSATQLRQRAVARWENEGGASVFATQTNARPDDADYEVKTEADKGKSSNLSRNSPNPDVAN